jgi:hypothetical protein
MTAYTVETDARLRLLKIVLHGYWDQQTFDAFAIEYLDALHHMNATGGLDIALVDGRDFAVQAKEISAQFGALIARCSPYLAKRMASVVPAHLNKLQAERAGGEMTARYFIDMDEARAWLFGPDTKG